MRRYRSARISDEQERAPPGARRHTLLHQAGVNPREEATTWPVGMHQSQTPLKPEASPARVGLRAPQVIGHAHYMRFTHDLGKAVFRQLVHEYDWPLAERHWGSQLVFMANMQLRRYVGSGQSALQLITHEVGMRRGHGGWRWEVGDGPRRLYWWWWALGGCVGLPLPTHPQQASRCGSSRGSECSSPGTVLTGAQRRRRVRPRRSLVLTGAAACFLVATCPQPWEPRLLVFHPHLQLGSLRSLEELFAVLHGAMQVRRSALNKGRQGGRLGTAGPCAPCPVRPTQPAPGGLVCTHPARSSSWPPTAL